jgi:hypothetical protein
LKSLPECLKIISVFEDTMIHFAVFLAFLATVLEFLGALFAMSILIYGIFIMITKSIVIGLVFIGASMVATFIGRLTCALLRAAAQFLAARAGA